MWFLLFALAAGGDPPDDALAAVPPSLSVPETGAPDPSRLEQLLRLDDQVQAGDRPAPEFEGPHDSFGAFFNTHFSSQAWKDYVWTDYLTQPAVLIPLGIGAGAAIISHWDKKLERNLRNSMTGTQAVGNVTLYTLIGGSLLSGLIFPGDGRNSWDEGFTQGEGFGATALTTWAFKESVRRPRPFSGGGQMHSFPSGHTSGAFCAATCIERNSGIWAAIPAYALATLTGYSRIDSARHYPSDVLAGAAIGMMSARIFDALHWGIDGKGGIARPDLRVTVEGRKEALLGLAMRF